MLTESPTQRTLNVFAKAIPLKTQQMFVNLVTSTNNVFNVKKQTTAQYAIKLSTEWNNQSTEHVYARLDMLKAIQLIFVSHAQFLDAHNVLRTKFVQNVLLHHISRNWRLMAHVCANLITIQLTTIQSA